MMCKKYTSAHNDFNIDEGQLRRLIENDRYTLFTSGTLSFRWLFPKKKLSPNYGLSYT